MGSWTVLPFTAPIRPVHVSLLQTGKVFFAGSGNDATNVNTPDESAVWDVGSGNSIQPVTPLNASGHPLDLFCGRQSFPPRVAAYV